MRRAIGMASMGLAALSCGPRNGVPVAPLRPGADLVSYEQARPLAGGRLAIGIVTPEGRDRTARAAIERAFAEAAAWQVRFSDEGEGSEIARVNAGAGRPVEVTADVLQAIRKGMTVSHASGGRFDEAAGGSRGVWATIEIDDQGCAERGPACAGTVRLPADARLSFAPVLPALLVDVAAATVREGGFDDFSTTWSLAPGTAPCAGYLAGDAGGEAWSWPVADPHGAGAFGTVSLRDAAFAASRAADAPTGAIVVAQDATTAAAYGAAASAAGADAGASLLRARGLESVLVTGTAGAAVATVTRGLRNRIDFSAFGGEVRWADGGREGTR